VKIVSLLLLSLLVPQALYGLMNVPVSEEHYVNEDVEIGRQLVISGPELEVKRESWLLDIQYPVDDYENISSGWGQRTVYGCKKCSTFHKGLDFTPGRGSNVYAAMDGVVSISDIGGEYGVYVILEHYIHEDLTYETVYAHLKRNKLTTNLYPGKKVLKGDIIGYVGNTGLSTGPHLHFEIRVNGVHTNPLRILQQNIND
jgi:murein DD-endopeptidase MepM/ murein hydrolase activator NlpD